jgi:hypothetical protein
VTELILEEGLLTQEQLDDILKPENMIRPRYIADATTKPVRASEMPEPLTATRTPR